MNQIIIYSKVPNKHTFFSKNALPDFWYVIFKKKRAKIGKNDKKFDGNCTTMMTCIQSTGMFLNALGLFIWHYTLALNRLDRPSLSTHSWCFFWWSFHEWCFFWWSFHESHKSPRYTLRHKQIEHFPCWASRVECTFSLKAQLENYVQE